MKKIFLLLIFAYLSILIINAQNTSDQNEAKYWVWRDRLVNDFMVPGNCTGCGIIMNTRGGGWSQEFRTYGEYQNGGFGMSDEGFEMGKYLVVLASEWRLLFNSRIATTNPEIISKIDLQMSKTELEIFYELQTIDRLDKDAERYWGEHMNWPLSGMFPMGAIDGFMIRDDVFDNFLWYNQTLPNTSYTIDAFNRYQYLNQGPDGVVGKYVQENILPTNGYPIGQRILSLSEMDISTRAWDGDNNGYPDSRGFSAAEGGIHASDNYGNITGPEEYSQDNYIGLLQGLVMVQQMVGSNIVVTRNGVSLNLASYAGTLIDRIIHSIKDDPIDNWLIRNPVTTECVRGVFWREYLDYLAGTNPIVFTQFTEPFFSICNAGGSQAECYSRQFAEIHNKYGKDEDFNGSLLHWVTPLDQKLNHLSALLLTMSDDGEIFNSVNLVACNWIDQMSGEKKEKFQYLDLLYCLLHKPWNEGDLTERSFAHYENILNNAPCCSNWEFDPSNINSIVNNTFDNLLSEMIVNNLLKILKGETYNAYSENNYTDNQSFYPFLQGGVIVGCNNYIEGTTYNVQPRISKVYNTIESSSEIGALQIGTNIWKAHVEYYAGEKVVLKQGFRVSDGAFFKAGNSASCGCQVKEGTYDFSEFQNIGNSYLANSSLNPEDVISKHTEDNTLKDIASTESNSYSNKTITIFPNPTSGIFTVDYDQENSSFMVVVTNILGDKVYSSDFVSGNLVIDLSNQSKGVYFIKVSDTNSVLKTDKIILQ